MVASQVTWAVRMASSWSSLIDEWIVPDSSSKKARNSRRWSSVPGPSRFIDGGSRSRCSSVSWSKPSLRTAVTTSRGVLTPIIGTWWSRANRKMSR